MDKQQLKMQAIEDLMESNPHADKVLDPLDLHVIAEEFYPKGPDGKEVKNPSKYSVVLEEGFKHTLDIKPEDRPIPTIEVEGIKATKQAISAATQYGIDLHKLKASGKVEGGKIKIKDVIRAHNAGEAQMDDRPKAKTGKGKGKSG